jgi:DNA adenine methylase
MRTLSLAIPETYPTPAVKWLGGKSNLIDQLVPLLPADVRTRRWFEPFAGGAALFFRLLPTRAVLSDTCYELFNVYRELQIGLDDQFIKYCIDLMDPTLNTREMFEFIRRNFNEHKHFSPTHRATWFLYLNRACFNGLHRVNSKGEFNAPFGDGKPITFDFNNMRACSTALRSAELHCDGFEGVLVRAQAGDVVYFDPPYLGTFTGYSGTFGIDEHRQLRDVFRTLDERGCVVMLSTNDDPVMRILYEGFDCTVVHAGRSVGSRGTSRGSIDELVIRGKTR